MIRATSESEALAHDRLLFPRSNVNDRGEPVFDLSPAKLLLRGDVTAGLHNLMTPSELQNSRNEYRPFKATLPVKMAGKVTQRSFLSFWNPWTDCPQKSPNKTEAPFRGIID